MTKTVGRVIGPLGALFVLFALFGRLLAGEFNGMVWLQLGLGLAGVAGWAATAFDDARNVATGRGTIYVATSTVTALLVVVLLGALNFVAIKKKKEWDFTKGGIHTLAEQTSDLLQKLDAKVKVTAFYQPLDAEYGVLEELLRRYKTLGGDHFEYEFVDPQKNPQQVKEMKITAASRIVVKAANGKEARPKELTEEALTNALVELGRGVEQKVFFLTGHGEKPIAKGADSALGLKLWVDGLANEGYRAEELNLLAKKDVPENALAVIVAGPQGPLADGERDALKRYADAGGHLVVMLDPGAETNLEPLLASWGLELQPGMVVDPDSQQPLWALSQQFADHPLAKPRQSIMGAMPFVMPEARGVKHGAGGEGFTATELFQTGASAWSETSPLAADGRVAREENDIPGPVNLAVAVSKKLEGEKELRALVIGDSDWVTNQYVRQGGNRDLALNSIQWLAGNATKITIRPKLREKSTLAMLTKDQQNLLSFGSLNLLPLALVALGLSVWSLRRSK